MDVIGLIEHILNTPNPIDPLEFETLGDSLKNALQINPVCVDWDYIRAIRTIARKKLKQFTKEQVYEILIESCEYCEEDAFVDSSIDRIKRNDMHDDIIISLEQFVVNYLQNNLKKSM
jgi:hypothetical protein